MVVGLVPGQRHIGINQWMQVNDKSISLKSIKKKCLSSQMFIESYYMLSIIGSLDWIQLNMGRKSFSVSDKMLLEDRCPLYLDRVSKFPSTSHTLFCLLSGHHEQLYEAAWFFCFYCTENWLRSQTTYSKIWLPLLLYPHTQTAFASGAGTNSDPDWPQPELVPTRLCSFTALMDH